LVAEEILGFDVQRDFVFVQGGLHFERFVANVAGVGPILDVSVLLVDLELL
jgi:hypothetical protein